MATPKDDSFEKTPVPGTAFRDSPPRRSAAESYLESPFRPLIENSFDVIKIIDPDGTILYTSPASEKVLGYRPEELIGSNIKDFMHGDDIDKACELMDQVIKHGGHSGFIEIRDRNKAGDWLTVEFVAQNLLAHPVIHGIVLNYRDISDRKKAEDALRRSEERYSKAFAASPNSITISLVSNGIFVEVNEGFERITGYTREEIIGKSSLELGVWPNPVRRTELTDLLKAQGSVRDFASEFVMKDGTVRSCVLSAEVIEILGENCIVANTRDVTEHMLAAEALEHSNTELTEKNIALKQILKHIDADKTAYRHEVCARVEDLLSPILAKLTRADGRLQPREIELLREGLKQIIDEDFDDFESNFSKLTPREMDICALIQQGLSSKEIADNLDVSPQTIDKHRQSIRRKLKLHNKDVNLAAYLRSQNRPKGIPNIYRNTPH